MVHQVPDEVRQVINRLKASSKKGHGRKGFSCRKSTFKVEGSAITVDSWKFNDWDYKRDDLPTQARGLFTTVRKDGIPEIVTRGYDKFFNIDEVPSTSWENIQNNTLGPYELSVKENGCIIFISGLEDGTLLVCSKHSTGPGRDAEFSHAKAGERWVEQHLSSTGMTINGLAKELREMNVTAVGELCDDTFEEHVLAYDENAAGIYLHGVNYNTPDFATLPSSEVHRLADKWGFKKAQFLLMDDITTVKGFLEKCAETGSWDGRDTEGFVIRCKIRDADGGPYRDWFFKYKFEQPYLMYRQWREATRALIGGRKFNARKHQSITEEYLQYAHREFVKNPELLKQYNKNHGIIAMRDGFLRERGLKGADIIAMENAGQLGDQDCKAVERNIILVPVASIGCGKTTVSVALTKLFGWGHIQNDNLPGAKNRSKRFSSELVRSLIGCPVSIADRNNHQKRERKQIMDDVLSTLPDARFVAFQYVHEPKEQLLDEIREITRERVLKRGDNHQTIKAGTKDSKEIISIMEGFLYRFEAVDVNHEPDDRFDEVIDLDIAVSSRDNLEKVVKAMHTHYPKLVPQMPTPEELDEAVNTAVSDYHVDVDLSWDRKADQKKAKTGATGPEDLLKGLEYFSISIPRSQVADILSSIFPPSTPPEKAMLYRHLQNSRRVQPSFHVTLVHRAHSKEHPAIWKGYSDLLLAKSDLPSDNPPSAAELAPARVRIERLVWDARIMAFVVRILPTLALEATAAGSRGEEREAWPCANSIPHITVGTASPEIKPKESSDLLSRWLEVGSGKESGIYEEEVPDVKVVDGSIQALWSSRR